MTRRAPAPRILIALMLFFPAAAPVGTQAQDAVLEEAPPIEEPIDLRRADTNDLMSLPEMDAATAAALLRCRRRPDLDLDGLFDCAAVPAGLRAEWRDAILWDPLRPGAAGAATLALRGRGGALAVGSDAAPPTRWLRRELRLSGRSGAFGSALRLRRDGAASAGVDDSLATRPTGVVRARLARGGLALTLGDFAPNEGLGGLVGLSGWGASRGVVPFRSPSAALEGWAPLSDASLDRSAPSGAARRLRGGAVLVRGRFLLSAFQYHPGDTATGVDSLAGRLVLSGTMASLWLGAAPLRGARVGFSVVPRLLRLDGRTYAGVLISAAPAGTSLMAEAVRDAAGRFRGGLTLEQSASGASLVQLTGQFVTPGFVTPLAVDSERAPTRGAALDEGRNGDASGGGISLRQRIRPGAWVTAAAAATLEPPTSRRDFLRRRGDFRAGVDLGLGAGWSARGDLRFESRQSPGPADGVDAPLRRPALLLRVNQDGRAGHLRLGWLLRLDIDDRRGGAAVPGAARVATVFDLRGRVRLSNDLKLGGGLALFDLPSGALVTLYEERPRELGSGVTVRGRGGREHLALDLDLPFGSAGAFLAREKLDQVRNIFWGSVLRVKFGGERRGGAN